MDVMIGEILGALHRNALYDDTLVVYSSDHGEQLGEHGLWWKQTFYEDSVKVPAIVSCPGLVPEGVRIDRVVSSLDLNAFMLDMLDCPQLPNSRGRSIRALLSDPQTNEWDDVALSEFCLDAAGSGGPFPEIGVMQRMIRRGPWKLNFYHGQPLQIFNLDDDPDEFIDRVSDPECANVREALMTELLSNWDPVEVSEAMAELRSDQKILSGWGRTVRPLDRYRWELRPEMDYLDR
jgi:choline-sulfatase